jgi:hypothetical protein
MARAPALLALALGLVCSAASFDARAEATAAEKETARNLVKSARGKLRQGEVAGALKDLEAAHAIMQVPTTGLELARAQVQAGQLVEARDTLLGVARQKPAKVEPFEFRRARRDATKLSEEVAKRIPTLRIDVIGKRASETRVAVDGVALASAALSAPLSLNPGPHVVELSRAGASRKTEITLSESQSRDVVLDATGLERPEAPLARVRPREPRTRTNQLVWIGFGVAGAGVAVGSVTGLLSMKKRSDIGDRCRDDRCPPDTHADIDSGEALADVSTVSFAIGAAGAAVGVYGLLNPTRGAAPAPKVGLSLGPGFAAVRGRF